MFVVKERTAGPSTARLNCLLRPEAGATNSEAPLWMTFVFSTRVACDASCCAVGGFLGSRKWMAARMGAGVTSLLLKGTFVTTRTNRRSFDCAPELFVAPRSGRNEFGGSALDDIRIFSTRVACDASCCAVGGFLGSRKWMASRMGAGVTSLLLKGTFVTTRTNRRSFDCAPELFVAPRSGRNEFGGSALDDIRLFYTGRV
jgi:hypothetical protein